MFTASHVSAICFAIMIGAASVALATGCLTARSSAVPPIAAAIPAPPLKLCTEPDLPPAAIASKPGYMQLAVTVTGKAGEPIAGLQESAFAANVGPQPLSIDYFRSDTAPRPVAVMLLVDTSGSMQPKLPTVHKALDDFMAKLNSCDEVALLAFSNHPYLLQPFTTDHEMVKSRFALFRAYGQTALYDSMSASLKLLDKASYARRALFLITDGIDNASASTEDEIITEARAANASVYCIGIGAPDAPHEPGNSIGPFVISSADTDRVDATTLNNLAQASHGRSFIVPEMDKDNGAAFKKAVTAIGDTIGHSYTIGIVAPPGSAPTPIITVAGHPDAIVRVQAEKLPPPAAIQHVSQPSHA